MKPGEQKTLVNSLTKIFICIGAIFSISLFTLSGWIADVLENPDLESGLKIFSIFPLFTLPAMGVEGIYTAIKETKTIAVYALITKILSLVFIVSPVIIFKSSYIGAVIGWGIANFIIFLLAMYMKSKPYVRINKEFVPNMYKLIFDYSLPLIGAFAAGFAINCADQFFISRYYGTDTFADFSNGNLSIPFAMMIASSVKSILLPALSKAQANDDLPSTIPLYCNAVIKSVKLILPIITFAIAFGGFIMTFLYSPKYSTSTPFFQFHALRDIIGAIPYLSVLLAFGFSRFYMQIHIAGVAVVWLTDALLVYIIKSPAYYIVFTQSLLQYIIVLGSFAFIYRKTGINYMSKSLVKQFGKILIHSGVIAVSSYFLISSFISSVESTLVSLIGLVCGLLAFAILLLCTGKFLNINYLEIITLLKQNKR